MMVCLLKTAFGRFSFWFPAQPCMHRAKTLIRKDALFHYLATKLQNCESFVYKK